MPFSIDNVKEFKEQGFTIIPDFFDAAEVAALSSEICKLKADGKFYNVSTDGDGETPTDERVNVNYQLCPTFPHSELMKTLPFSKKVISAVEQLIGDPYLQQLCQIFLKPSKVGAGTNWHQDNAYFKIENPLQGTAMWIAIDEATSQNGTLELIPNSFENLLEHSRDPNSNHHIRCFPDESKAVKVEVPPGGVAFFCYGAPHCTRENLTDKDRAGLAYHFIRLDGRPVITDDDGNEVVTLQPGPGRPILSGPDASWGEKEYGENLETRFDELVQELS
ncbi:MAG: phytanoyl-CoA dioxygenase family protein [Lentisphaeria bacterium]|nr:phytanoyl-CoA dioxygenase family protein [Lentisphaeria bacterium]NQZ70737.1 phytanoyl-CoA dioxygenase family protein [Lentisphaeria bacterium]